MSRRADSEPDVHSLRDVVAIDGPSGAGKSTVARQLAARLGWRYLDTGAMYRAVTWHLLERHIDGLDDVARVAAAIAELDLELDPEGRVRLDGKDVSPHLRSQEVEARVSAVSALGAVRARMRALQRELARRGPLVAEGRDMGSIVFPAARWKFYLDADPRERARRRWRDFVAQGRRVSERDVLEEIEVRDHLDSTRGDAPLVRADGARVVDTTSMTLEDVVAHLAQLVDSGAEHGGQETGA